MTRAEKRLYLSWARYRRRFGGGQPEVCLPSRFLNEVPPSLRERLSPHSQPHVDEVDLYSEQHDVRESVKRNMYTGRTYNSVENIAQFFSERGMPPPSGFTRKPDTPKPPPSPSVPAVPSKAAPKTAPGPAQATFPELTTQPAARPVARSLPAAQGRTLAARQALGFRAGAIVNHPKYGRGTVLRREGDGEDAKLTISFPGYGLKKIVEKYAGIKIEE
jgi:DNA helicase-2/ATP-dependent DNA helicase PcrA